MDPTLSVSVIVTVPRGSAEWSSRVTLVLLTWYWMKPASSLPSHDENTFWTVKPAERNSFGVNTKQSENTT